MDIEFDQRPPGWSKLLREGPALFRMMANQWRGPALSEPIGNGQPVLIVPGFLSGDETTRFLRKTLEASGFAPFGWRMGFNLGARADLPLRLLSQLKHVLGKTGRPVILVGWSLGGLYVRELAKLSPDAVKAVVTLGSPFSGDPRLNNAWRLYEFLNNHKVDAPPIDLSAIKKPPVHTVAIWSAEDGVVSPTGARGTDEEVDERIEDASTHMGFGGDPFVVREIVRVLGRLAEMPDSW